MFVFCLFVWLGFFCFTSKNTDLQIIHLQLSLNATHITWNHVSQKTLSIFYVPEEILRISLALYIVPSFPYWSTRTKYLKLWRFSPLYFFFSMSLLKTFFQVIIKAYPRQCISKQPADRKSTRKINSHKNIVY